MPVQPTYPGVYIEEIPSGVRTITGVATSITAFIGRARRGPVNAATTINSYADFERIFGGLWSESLLAHAVRDFYLNGGNQAIIVRLFNPTFATDAARQSALTAATQQAQTAADAVAQAATTAAAATGASAQSVATAAAGALAAARAAGEAAMTAGKTVSKAAAEAAGAAGATAQSVATAATAAVAQAVTDAAKAAVPVTKAQLAVDGLTLEAADEGTWGNSLRTRVDHDVSGTVANDLGLAKSDLFNLTVRDTAAGLTEHFRNLTVKDSPRSVDIVLKGESLLVRAPSTLPGSVPATHPAPAAGKDAFEDDNASTKVPAAKMASDGRNLERDSFTGNETETAKKGLYALEQADLFNLLCIPPYRTNGDASKGGDIDKELIDDAVQYCAKRRALFLIDPPSSWSDKEKAKSGVDTDVGTPSKNAAVFFPRLRRANTVRGNQLEDFPPCGAVAGIFARTDTSRGVWKAPAGLEATIAGTRQLSVSLTDAENGELNPKGINCLRAMPATGPVIWGSRTREGDDRTPSDWKYIPVRRLALYIEESLYRGTQWVIFEPNDEPLWAQIRLNVGAFMHNLFRQGAFQGRMPRDAYFVKCDKETTTQNDINLGIVNIVVGFAPLKPVEFVIIRIQQMVGQIQT